jgi:hypothetical protein
VRRSIIVAILWLICAVGSSAPAAGQSNWAGTESGDPVAQRVREADAARRAAIRARDRARASMARARASMERARREASRNGVARRAAEQESLRAREEARSDEVAANREKQRADRLDAAASAAQDAQRDEERSKWFAVAAGGGAILLLLVTGLVLRHRARRRASRELDELKRRRPDPVPGGMLLSSRLNLQLPGDKLPEGAGGVIVGRNPKVATAVISKEDVSRRHARFFFRDGQYWLEDVGSAEGSWVNGERLDEGVPVPVAPGAEVRFAAYAFRFDVDG